VVTGQGRALHSGQIHLRSALPLLVALVLGQEERYRVSDAVRGRSDVVFVDSVADLTRYLSTERRPVGTVLTEATDREGQSVENTVRELRTRLPELVIVGYCRTGHEHSGAIRSLAAAGVHELIFRDIDDRGVALRTVLVSAAHACTADVVLNHLRPLIPQCLHGFVALSLRNPDKAHTVGDVARALGLNRKTLVNYCSRSMVPPPSEILAWCRLLLVAQYLSVTSRTVESIAMQLDFPSDTALRNMMKRYTGLRAQEVRAQGGLSCVLPRLAGALASHRYAVTEERQA
jgi:AraC-like DNA-binding protein